MMCLLLCSTLGNKGKEDARGGVPRNQRFARRAAGEGKRKRPFWRTLGRTTWTALNIYAKMSRLNGT